MTEIVAYQPDSLVIAPEQTGFTDAQRAALAHIGVEHASDGDLAVFFHHCQRTGLDPFLKQIYMIGRQSSEKDANGNWVRVVKQTIQTGIDGYRVVGRRAAARSGDTLSVGAPEWAHEDGSWRPVWSRNWGLPVAARVTVFRNGEPFPGVALFDEYKQTKRGGDLNSMWDQRPAGQIAKCAEALAWRKAFPHDLAGIYTDDELARASNVQEKRATGLAAVLTTHEEPAPESPHLDPKSPLARRMFATLNEAGVPRDEVHATCAEIVGREITTSHELTDADAELIIDTMVRRGRIVRPADDEPAFDPETGEVEP